ncbi:DUF3304 domain-containing protein [Pseudoduganella violaceinigra]|uniref:DUF3304 domain-containing protein n=1 Tax=Pseudoduganella violaceinigra TaxID=246602 RepID=UPI000A0071D4|nr:DUF3304 domain-containing protein [Pseudoduganella violaceinigra]
MKVLIIIFAMVVTACSTHPSRDDSVYGASVGIVNHTSKYIHSALANGAGGANMGAWGAGGANVCCVIVPSKWYPGLKVHVRWNMPEGSKDVYKEKIVEVERYEDDDGGSLYIHIFPNDEVRVVVSTYAGWSTKHPIPASKKPAPESSQ